VSAHLRLRRANQRSGEAGGLSRLGSPISRGYVNPGRGPAGEVISRIRRDRRMTDNEKRVRAFYDAIVPGHRVRVCSLQSSQVVYELPEGMPTGGGRFEGVPDVPERFLPAFYGAFDVRFVAEESSSRLVSRWSRSVGCREKLGRRVFRSMSPSPTCGR